MGKELFMIAATILILFFNTLPNLNAQNATTNTTASMGTSENQTFSVLGKIPGNVRNDTLNDTGEAAQKIGEGAVDIMSNITAEIKEGVSGNSTNISK
jgi:hypothetical protein